MPDLLDQYKPDDAKALREVFEMLGFPIPLKREFHSGHANIVFCTPFGFNLRIQDATKYPAFRHENFLRPLGSIRAGAYRVDIQQGGHLVRRRSEATHVYDKILEAGIELIDIYGHKKNLIYCGSAANGFPDGMPVAYDPSIILVFNDQTRIFDNLPGSRVLDLLPHDNETPDFQDIHYGDLRTCFSKVACKNSGEIDKTAIKSFLEKCRQATNEGRLVASWKEQSFSQFWLKGLSKRYEERLTASCETLKHLTAEAG